MCCISYTKTTWSTQKQQVFVAGQLAGSISRNTVQGGVNEVQGGVNEVQDVVLSVPHGDVLIAAANPEGEVCCVLFFVPNLWYTGVYCACIGVYCACIGVYCACRGVYCAQAYKAMF